MWRAATDLPLGVRRSFAAVRSRAVRVTAGPKAVPAANRDGPWILRRCRMPPSDPPHAQQGVTSGTGAPYVQDNHEGAGSMDFGPRPMSESVRLL